MTAKHTSQEQLGIVKYNTQSYEPSTNNQRMQPSKHLLESCLFVWHDLMKKFAVLKVGCTLQSFFIFAQIR